MTGTDFYIYIVISLFGVAYPLLLQVIARLDEKYSSEHIVSLFDREIEGRAFKYSLFASLGSIGIWTIGFEPLIQVDGLNLLINNSAAIILAASTVVLVIVFFLYVRKILIYYTPTKFIQYLRSNHSIANDDFSYFEALSDILLLSIKKQQRNLSLTLSDFFYTAFKQEREKHQNVPVVYPDLYYEIVHKSIEELAILKEKRIYSLEYRTGGGIWLLGELQGSKISDRTYSWIWRNLLLIVRYKQDDMIVYHWETAHQYYTYSLQPISSEYDYSSGNLQVSNQEEVNKRKLEREKFIEFHYALGSLLLYKQMYNCIKRIFSHTNSQPPKYELLPDSMNEVFKFYFHARDPYDTKYAWISHIYPFPELSGLNADGVIKKWISSYMALLFLRQYTIIPYLTITRPLDYPPIPRTQGEIKEWIDGLDFFKKLTTQHLENKVLLKELNLAFLTPEWCDKNNKVYPTVFIDNFKARLEDAYHTNALNIPLSNDKIAQFNSSTKKILEETLAEFSVLNNHADIVGESDKWVINGQKMLQSKDAFAESPEVHHISFDSFLASGIARDIKDRVAYTFQLKKSKSYLLKTEDIFPAIIRLNLDDQFLIICFGLNIAHFINDLKVPGLTAEKFQETQILHFEGSRFIDSSIFILRREDLPNIKTREISQDVIDKYSLNKISNIIELHTSVIDLNNTTPELFEESRQGRENDELKKSVLLNVIISTEIRWKKGIEMVQINQYSEYDQKGLPNNLNEIKPIG